MSAFQLDTSGRVHGFAGNTQFPRDYREWSDLDAFTQGYIEALFAELQAAVDAKRYGLWQRSAFSDLAPETLARIIEDCEQRAVQFGRAHYDATEAGAEFWNRRQRGQCALVGFPPLTVTLGDDGKVYLR